MKRPGVVRYPCRASVLVPKSRGLGIASAWRYFRDYLHRCQLAAFKAKPMDFQELGDHTWLVLGRYFIAETPGGYQILRLGRSQMAVLGTFSSLADVYGVCLADSAIGQMTVH